MAERILLGAEDATARLTGQTITSVEFVEGETEDEDYAVIRVGDLTLYASTPSVYASDRPYPDNTPAGEPEPGEYGHEEPDDWKPEDDSWTRTAR